MTPTIAVVAVHSVADQKPNESARAISHLLLSLRRGLDTRFTSFREFGIALPNRRVDIPVASGGSSRPGRFEVRARFLRESPGGSVTDPDYQFMRNLLGSYQQAGEDAVYQTVRLEGGRLADDEAADPQQGRASVHIYEAYWADLSRVSDRLYRILGEFYQLILHLPFLGLQALDLRRAAADNRKSPWWSGRRAEFEACLWILTLPIAILNVLLLAIGLSVLPGMFPEPWHPYIAVGTAALVSATLSGRHVLRRWTVRRPTAWIPAAVFTLLATLVTAWAIGGFSSSGPTAPGLFLQLGFGWWLASGGLMYLLFRGYDRHRPGALTVAVPFYLAVTARFLFVLWNQENSKDGLDQAMLHTLEPTFWVLSIFWLALALLATWHLVRGWLGRWWRPSFRFGTPDASALFTSRLALSLSIGIFSQVTVLLWAVLLTTVAPWLVPRNTPFDPEIFEPAPGPMPVGEFLAGILNSNGAPVFVVGVLLSILMALIVIWTMGPSVWAEIRPIRPSTDPAAVARSQRYGLWLSSGFRFQRIAGELAAIAVVAGTVLAVVNLVSRFTRNPIEWGVLGTTPDSVLGRVELFAITGTLAGLFALGRFADSLALGFRPALDVLLDVDNYLREHPRRRTPRARIAERYTTLLRHLCRWKDSAPGASGAPYSAIIIVAHSQGTVITADLLRFLRCERGANPQFEPDLDRLLSDALPEDERLPVYFLTMGCPLRQLYRLRFPDLYRWVGLTGGAGSIGPEPQALRVARWVNLYRSGDYVGRSLWTSDSDPNLFVPSQRPRRINEVQAETCIGAGAHTHYWDDTAPMVASELDRLIKEAIA